jgi:hypothetical protein
MITGTPVKYVGPRAAKPLDIIEQDRTAEQFTAAAAAGSAARNWPQRWTRSTGSPVATSPASASARQLEPDPARVRQPGRASGVPPATDMPLPARRLRTDVKALAPTVP